MAVIGTSHSAYSSYSSIKLNSEEYKKQSSSTELEKKMTQYTDTFSISKKGQENLKHLSSISSMDYVNWFEKEVTEVFAKEDTTQGVKSDTFEHHVNRMAVWSAGTMIFIGCRCRTSHLMYADIAVALVGAVDQRYFWNCKAGWEQAVPYSFC